MTDCLWWIWKQSRIRWDSIRQRTGVSCATTQFLPSSSQRSSTSKTDPERFGKEEYKEEQLSPKKRSRYDHGQARETSWHNTKQETIEPGQLRAISSTAEIIKENRSRQKKQTVNRFLQMWKEAWRMDSRTRKERSSYRWERLPIHSFNHSYNFELPSKSNEANAMAHQKIRYIGLWCATISEDAQKSPTQSPNNRSISKAESIAGIKRSIHGSHFHQRTSKKKKLQNWERSK